MKKDRLKEAIHNLLTINCVNRMEMLFKETNSFVVFGTNKSCPVASFFHTNFGTSIRSFAIDKIGKDYFLIINGIKYMANKSLGKFIENFDSGSYQYLIAGIDSSMCRENLPNWSTESSSTEIVKYDPRKRC